MDYRTAYGELLCAIFKFDEALGSAHTNLMLEVRRIENNLDKTLPPIMLAKPPDESGEP